MADAAHSKPGKNKAASLTGAARLPFNGWPATTDCRFTPVRTAAIYTCPNTKGTRKIESVRLLET